MMHYKTIFYKKQGRRYVPVCEFDSDLMESLPYGNHLIMVNQSSGSRRYNIDPDYAAMIAAGRVAEDAVLTAIEKTLALRPQKQPITKEQQALWRALADSFHQQDYPLIRAASVDALRAGINAMQIEAEKLLANPAVRQAWDHFQLVCSLTKDN